MSQIGWQIKTSSDRYSGTDTPVTVEIIRDSESIITLNVEPGGTERLDRGNDVFYWWNFQGTKFVPGDIVTWIASLPYPDAVEFPDDIGGHLRSRFRAHGDDLWEKDEITVYVTYAEYHHIPGTIDSFEWKDGPWTHAGFFPVDAVISTDPAEGFKTWTLLS